MNKNKDSKIVNPIQHNNIFLKINNLEDSLVNLLNSFQYDIEKLRF